MDTYSTFIDSDPFEKKEKNYTLAGFWSRFFALIIDGFIVSFANLAVPHNFISSENYSFVHFNYSPLFIAQWLYYALLQSGNMQATLGQRLFRIKLISLNGNKVNFGQATGRFFASYLSAFLFGIGYLMFFFNDKNQCLHDRLAGTLVIEGVAG
jgi:uncharacterized RDD family membrane protein YckC